MKQDLPEVVIYTDGSYFEELARGGYGALMNCQGHTCMVYGSEDNTTNNRMELMAVINSLAQLNEPCVVDLHSDSTYVVNSINKKWIDSWEKNSWKKADGQPVKNQDLLVELSHHLKHHKVNAFWVKSHNGQFENELCDAIAKAEALSDR